MDIWDVDYKSTSDEEDNDSEEDEYGNAFPKPKQFTDPEKRKEYEKEKEKKANEARIKKYQNSSDVVAELIAKDKALVRRDLEARLSRVKYQ